MECKKVGEIKIGGVKFNVYVFPFPTSDYQLVITDVLNEIIAVVYCSVDDKKVVWKYGAPKEDIRKNVEEQIIAALQSTYFHVDGER